MTPISRARRWLISLSSGLLLSASVLADDVFVLSDVAPVLESPAFSATTLAEPVKGARLTVIGEQKQWLEVTYQEQTGWVSRWLVGTTPPKDKVTHLDGEMDADEVRLRASDVATAGAVRGLNEGETEFGGGTDYAELERMEALQPDAVTLSAFRTDLEQQ